MDILIEIQKEEMEVQNLVRDWHIQKLANFIEELIKKDRTEQLLIHSVVNWIALIDNIKPEEDVNILVKFKSGKVRCALFSSADYRFYNPVNDQDITEFIQYYASMPE